MSRFLPPVPSEDGGGFYGIVVKDDITTVITDSIEFLGADFDVSASGDGALVELDAAAGGGGGTGGFYGVIFKESEAGGAVFRDDTLIFDSNFFYLSSGGESKPIVSLDFTPDPNFSYRTIIAGSELTIPLYQQMAVFGCILVEGQLNTDGQLVVEE